MHGPAAAAYRRRAIGWRVSAGPLQELHRPCRLIPPASEESLCAGKATFAQDALHGGDPFSVVQCPSPAVFDKPVSCVGQSCRCFRLAAEEHERVGPCLVCGILRCLPL